MPPANTIWLLTVIVLPAVLPRLLAPAEKAGAPMEIVLPLREILTIPVCDRLETAGADICIMPPLNPALTPPWALIESDRASIVLLDDWPVELPLAYIPRV